jgi:hypothetical protein
MQSHCHLLPFPSTESLSKLSWNVMERLPINESITNALSIDVAHWAVNGENVEIPLDFAYVRRNLTWLDKTHAFTMWEGFKVQGFMSCLHNVWDHPHFHQRSSCSLIVIFCHSHQWNLCRNSLEMSRNIFQLTIPSPMPLSTDSARWAMNGANVEIPSTWACMCRNLTWLDKTHAFTVWEGFKAQVCMSFLHNICDHPRFHQRSSCSLIVIIHHPNQWNLCWNSLEMSWNVFQQANHQCHYTSTSHVEQWMGPTLKFLQLVLVCVEIWHGYIRHMPSWCGMVSRLKDACRARIMSEIVHVFINVYHVVSFWSFTIPINEIFIETLLKCHGTSSNKPITNAIIHRCRKFSSEWGQRWNSFNLCLYVS